jgi:hypothetical protein
MIGNLECGMIDCKEISTEILRSTCHIDRHLHFPCSWCLVLGESLELWIFVEKGESKVQVPMCGIMNGHVS